MHEQGHQLKLKVKVFHGALLATLIAMTSTSTAKPLRDWQNTTYLPPEWEPKLEAVGLRHCLWGDGTYTTIIGTLVGDRKTVLSVGHGWQHLRKVGPGKCTFTLYDQFARSFFSSAFVSVRTAEPPEAYVGRQIMPDWSVGTLATEAPARVAPITVVCVNLSQAIATENWIIVTYQHPNLPYQIKRKAVTRKLSVTSLFENQKMIRHNGNTLPEDSGAPIIGVKKGIPYVFGVHVGGLDGEPLNVAQLVTNDAVAQIKGAFVVAEGKGLVSYSGSC